MAESPNLSSNSERAARLAERFGMTRADIEHLLTNTNSEYAGGSAPVPETPKPEAPVTPILQSSRPQPLGAAALTIIFAILLIGLAIALSLKEGYFQQRKDRQTVSNNSSQTKPADSTQKKPKGATDQASSEDDPSAPPFQPTVVPPGELPPEAQVGNRIQAPRHVATASARPLLQTSSEFEAQEKLADLRADGNTHARIKSVRKHGTVSYQVLGK
jgi:hypothetical protein